MKLFTVYSTMLLLLISYGAESQDSVALRKMLKDENYCDDSRVKSKGQYTNMQLITNYTMNRLIRKDLSIITLDDEGLPSLGNYATLNFKENNTQANLHTSFYNPFGKKGDAFPIKSILSLNFSAGLNEGVSVLFTNKSLNNKAGVTGKWSFISRKTNYVNNSAMDCNTMKLARERLLIGFQQEQSIYDIRVKKTLINNELDCDDDVKKSEAFRKVIDSLNKQITIVKTKEDSCNVIKELEKTTLEYHKHILAVRKKQDENRIYIPENTVVVAKFWKGKVRQYLDSMMTIESSLIRFDQFTLQWWDIDLSLNGEKYNLLNTAVSLDSQLSKKSFTRWGVGATFNRFSSNARSGLSKYGLFWKVSYKLGNDNSLGGAELKEVVTTTTTTAGNRERTSSGKLNAFTTPFVRSFSHSLDMQLSRYMNEDKSRAFIIRLNGTLGFDEMKNLFKTDEKPDLSAGVGYYISLLNAKDKKGTVDFELFFNFTDILNSGVANNKFYNRRQAGIKFGVPFSSIFMN